VKLSNFMANRIKKVKSKGAVTASVRSKSRFSFFRESIEELKKAQWPTKREALRLSILVTVICAFVGGLLGLLDLGFTKVLTELILGG